MRAAVPQRPVAVLAYGSLLDEPGPELAAVTIGRRPCRTPFGVEYGRASQRWGGGPVLVPHARGAPVTGALLLLGQSVTLGAAVEMLAAREGLPDGRGVVEVALPGGLLVLAASLPRNLPAPDMEPGALARRAAASVANGPRNGVAYLRRALASGIETRLTQRYQAALLRLTGAETLEAAERRLVASAAASTEGGTHGLG